LIGNSVKCAAGSWVGVGLCLGRRRKTEYVGEQSGLMKVTRFTTPKGTFVFFGLFSYLYIEHFILAFLFDLSSRFSSFWVLCKYIARKARRSSDVGVLKFGQWIENSLLQCVGLQGAA
jgi:hypothetical protein